MNSLQINKNENDDNFLIRIPKILFIANQKNQRRLSKFQSSSDSQNVSPDDLEPIQLLKELSDSGYVDDETNDAIEELVEEMHNEY